MQNASPKGVAIIIGYVRIVFHAMGNWWNESSWTMWDDVENVVCKAKLNFLGSYSFNQVGRNFVSDANKLMEKFGNIWFSGDATNTEGWLGTTVGAWDTGELAARDMAESVKDRKLKSSRM